MALTRIMESRGLPDSREKPLSSIWRRYFYTLKFFGLILFFTSFAFFPVPDFAGSSGANVRDLNSVLTEGKKQIRNGLFEEAKATLEQGLTLEVESGDEKLRAECFLNLGLVLWNLGEIEESSEYYARADILAERLNLSLMKKISETSIKIIDLYSKGMDYRNSGRLAESVASLQKAIGLAREIRSLPHELKCLRAQSMNYVQDLENDKFLELNRKALEIARILNHRIEIVKTLNSIGVRYFTQNDLSYALAFYSEALKLAREIDYADRMPRSFLNITNVYMLFGDFQKSYEYLSEALSVNWEKKNKAQVPSILNSLGILFENKALTTRSDEDFNTALEYFEEATKLFRDGNQDELENMALNNIGIVYSGLKLYEKALKYFGLCLEKLKDGRDSQFLGVILTNIGDIRLELQNFAEAERLFLQALELGEETGATDIMRRAHFGLARIREAQKKYGRSIFHYQEAIGNVEKVRGAIVLDVNKAGYIHTKLNIYEYLLNLYYRMDAEDINGDFGPEMFYTAELGKARSFLENLTESKIDVTSQLSDEYRKKEAELTSRISAYLQELARGDESLQINAQRIENELKKADEDYTLLLQQMLREKAGISGVISPKPFFLNYIQERYLDQHTVLIEFYLGEKRSFLFFISQKNLEVFELPPHPEIKDSVKAYLKILTEPSKEDYILKKGSRRLYTELFSQVEKVMPDGITNLIVIPDGILYYLPFETLISSAAGPSGRDEYLISKYGISYMPSASSLLFLSDKKTDTPYPKEILLLGEPDYTTKPSLKGSERRNPMEIVYELYKSQGYEFLPLPYSRKEIKSISRYFPSPKRDVFLGGEANEANVKSLPLEDYRVIHLACHSFLDEAYPLRSSLVLSFKEKSDEDGFLKVREIYHLDLRPELIVLSACHTGKGKMEGSDGVLGLPRIFFYAGAKSVVSTLWGINDQSTVSFMNYFYRSLSEGQGKAQALRRAKIEMIESKYSHPYHWGAFILNGDYRAAVFSK